MTGKQITTIKFLALKIKIAMQENDLTIDEVSSVNGDYNVQVGRLLNNVCGLPFYFPFRTLMNICITLRISNIHFDENEISKLHLKYKK